VVICLSCCSQELIRPYLLWGKDRTPISPLFYGPALPWAVLAKSVPRFEGVKVLSRVAPGAESSPGELRFRTNSKYFY
jgi:hypothetical protein